MRRSVFALCLVLLFLLAGAARAEDAVRVQASNQLSYSLNSDPDRASTDPQEILENYFDADIRVRNFLVGFRYEAFHPPFQSGPDSLREGIAMRYAEVGFPYGGVRVGNFYEIFGRGLLFRSYEERSIGVDANMDGVLLWGSGGPVTVKGFSGRMREAQTEERSAVLRGTDVGIDVMPGVAVGGSYLLQSATDPKKPGASGIAEPLHVEAIGGRLSYTHDLFDIYYEGGRLNRLFLTSKNILDGHSYDDVRGTGHYGAVNFFPVSGLAVTAEYKEYERFRFQPEGATGTDYNQPPAVTRETGYTLISRHPHELLPEDEKGFQVEAVLAPRMGTTVTVSRAESNKLSGEPTSKPLAAKKAAFAVAEGLCSKVGKYRARVPGGASMVLWTSRRRSTACWGS